MLQQLVAENAKISLAEEREVQVQASIAMQWRLSGFHVELDSYGSGPANRRPDFGILLPVTKEYLFVELKLIGQGRPHRQVQDDVDKLNAMFKDGDKRVGLLTVGFAAHGTHDLRFKATHKELDEEIEGPGLYKKVGLSKVQLDDIDDHLPYAWVGMWARGPNLGGGD